MLCYNGWFTLSQCSLFEAPPPPLPREYRIPTSVGTAHHWQANYTGPKPLTQGCDDADEGHWHDKCNLSFLYSLDGNEKMFTRYQCFARVSILVQWYWCQSIELNYYLFINHLYWWCWLVHAPLVWWRHQHIADCSGYLRASYIFLIWFT